MKSLTKPPIYQAAFSLLELIVVVVILAIISGYTLSKFTSSSSYKKDAIVEQIISAARMTQQLSMNDSSRSFSLSIQSNQIDLLADGVSLSAAGLGFPLTFSSNVSLSPLSSIVFDNWGATSATTISVQLDTTINVCFESSGYIHRC
ncbi:MAG: prepilin-type N-terminal cleavage/methylation domain-containing protein [Enterobacterales bacterium]|nr:prepilin-type N-terminal cleavage/methylation domain-containing protein [Enterobacterales bacterium]